MKKIICIMLAMLLLITFQTSIFSADLPVTGDAAWDFFDSIDEFKEAIEAAIEAVDDIQYTYEYQYLNRLDGFYLPVGTSINDITNIDVSKHDCEIYLNYGEYELSMTYDFGTQGETKSYSNAKLIGENDPNIGRALTSDEGTPIYFYVRNSRTIEESYYYWLQDDMTFILTVNVREYDDKFLSLCHAVYHSFDEIQTLSLEVSSISDKVKLSWDEIVEDETYTVYWKRSSSDEWKVATTTVKHKVNITGLKSGVSYDFMIEASGVESEIVTITAK